MTRYNINSKFLLKDHNESNAIFSFITIISFTIFYYFSESSGVNRSTFIYLCGFVLFFINISSLNFKNIFSISTIIFVLSVYIEFIFWTISFAGIALSLYIIYCCNGKFYRILLSVIFVIIYTFSYSLDGEGNVHYLKTLLDLQSKDIDLFFHSTIASNYKFYDSCSTGVHGLKSFHYWDLSNLLCSKLSNTLDIRSIDFYSFMYPAMIMPLLLKYSNDLVYRVSDKLRTNKHFTYSHAISIALLVSLSFLTLHPYFGPVQNFLKWPCHRTFNLLIGFIITLKFTLVLIEIIKVDKLKYSNLLLALYSIVFIYLIAKTKYYFLYFALLSSFLLCFMVTSRETIVKFRILFISCLVVFLYFTFYIDVKTSSHFEIQPFHIWKLNANEHHTLWSPFSIGFPIVLIILLTNFRFHLSDFFSLRKVRSKHHIIFLILILNFFMALFPTFIFGGEYVRNLLYPINTYYFFLSIPFAIILAKYLSTIKYKNLSLKNTLFLLFLFLTFFHSSSTALINAHHKFNDHQQALLDYKNPNDKLKKILLINDTLFNLSTTKLPDAVLWVPKKNKEAWQLLTADKYALPFVFSSLSELPLIYGFPEIADDIILEQSHGYTIFEEVPRNLNSDLNQSIEEAKRLGFQNLYVLNSLTEITLHKI
jgi:hypothetical protein